jgi:sec-independent protein translocase protein TatA
MGGGLMNPVHLAFVAMVALIFLGPKKLPELARSIGAGMREFRESMSIDHEAKAPVADLAPVSAPPPAGDPAQHEAAAPAHETPPAAPPSAPA